MAKANKPNILVIWGDDIGIWNLSCYSGGMMGYRTPNIDRLAAEGMRFTDSYGEQSCTAGRASFITGQSVFRTGLVQGRSSRLTDRPRGRRSDDRGAPQAARVCDRTVREEPPRRSEPVPADRARLRRVLRQPLSPQRRGRSRGSRLPEGPQVQGEVRPARRAALLGDGHGRSRPSSPAGDGSASRRSRIPGRSTRKRMETCDDEFVAAAKDFIKRQHEAGKPFFCWLNTTHMHLRTHTKPTSLGQAGRQPVPLPRHHDRPRQERGRDAGLPRSSSGSPRTPS